ncbi:hypothetical protein Gotur_019611 [Gossypium turneri]
MTNHKLRNFSLRMAVFHALLKIKFQSERNIEPPFETQSVIMATFVICILLYATTLCTPYFPELIDDINLLAGSLATILLTFILFPGLGIDGDVSANRWSRGQVWQHRDWAIGLAVFGFNLVCWAGANLGFVQLPLFARCRVTRIEQRPRKTKFARSCRVLTSLSASLLQVALSQSTVSCCFDPLHYTSESFDLEVQSFSQQLQGDEIRGFSLLHCNVKKIRLGDRIDMFNLCHCNFGGIRESKVRRCGFNCNVEEARFAVVALICSTAPPGKVRFAVVASIFLIAISGKQDFAVVASIYSTALSRKVRFAVVASFFLIAILGKQDSPLWLQSVPLHC